MDNYNDKKALKSGVWYIVSNFIAKGAVFITTPIFTRLMSVDDIGMFSNVSAWVHILMIITSLELMTSVTFAKFEYGADSLNGFISSVLVLSSSVTFAFYAIVLVFHDFFMTLFKVDFLSLNLMFLYCLVSPALQMIQVKNRVLFQYKSSTILSIASVFSSTLSSLALVVFMQDKLAGRTIGYFGSLIIFNLIIYLFILYQGKTVNPHYWKFALSISIPMVIHGLSGQLLSSCDRIMITRMIGSSQNALYSIAYTCSSVISVLWSSLNTAWSPWAYDQMEKENFSKLKKASKPYIVLFFIIVTIFMLVAPELMLIMGGRHYLSAVACTPPIVVGMFFQFVYSVYVNIEFFNKKQKYTAVGTTIAAVLNVVLNWLLIPVFGYIAAAYTTLIGYIALFVIHFLIVRRMGKTWWYDTRFNLGILTISIISIPILTLLYGNNVIRWSFIAIMACLVGAFIFKRRKELISAIRARSIEGTLRALNFGKER